MIGLASSLSALLLGPRGGLLAIAGVAAMILIGPLLGICIVLAIDRSSIRDDAEERIEAARASASSCSADLTICRANAGGQGAAIELQNESIGAIAADCRQRDERNGLQAIELLARPDAPFEDTVAGMNQWLDGYAR